MNRKTQCYNITLQAVIIFSDDSVTLADLKREKVKDIHYLLFLFISDSSFFLVPVPGKPLSQLLPLGDAFFWKKDNTIMNCINWNFPGSAFSVDLKISRS